MSARKVQPGAARTQSYRAAAEQLAQIAAELEDGETDLDKVLVLLSQAQAAYAVCKERIDALRSALDEDGERPLPSNPTQEDDTDAEDAAADADSDDDLYF